MDGVIDLAISGSSGCLPCMMSFSRPLQLQLVSLARDGLTPEAHAVPDGLGPPGSAAQREECTRRRHHHHRREARPALLVLAIELLPIAGLAPGFGVVACRPVSGCGSL